MNQDTVVSFSLEVNVEDAYKEVRKLETILARSLNMVKRLSGGDENLQTTIDRIQRLITVVNSLRLAYRALQLARMATGDPIAWGLAIISGAEVAFTVADSMAMEADTH